MIGNLNHKVMGLIKEPKNVDFSNQSEPWTENELADFRKLMQELKLKNKKQVSGRLTKKNESENSKIEVQKNQFLTIYSLPSF